MTEKRDPVSAAFLEFVRGIRRPASLKEVGIEFSMDAGRVTFATRGDLPPIQPTAQDIQAGLEAHGEDLASARTWARLILAANAIDLSLLQADPAGEGLLNLLWDLSDDGVSFWRAPE